MRFLYIGIWLLLGILSPNGLAAQYEYIIPRTEVASSGSISATHKNSFVAVLVSSQNGSGRLFNGCGYDTSFSFLKDKNCIF
jgi:hypothetical protein